MVGRVFFVFVPVINFKNLDTIGRTNYALTMKEVRKSSVYNDWFMSLRDSRAKTRIDSRVQRLAGGNPGDVKPVGEGISEMRIDYGPGYRIYYIDTGKEIIILLCGGDKKTQQADIVEARKIARDYEEED